MDYVYDLVWLSGTAFTSELEGTHFKSQMETNYPDWRFSRLSPALSGKLDITIGHNYAFQLIKDYYANCIID
jgi:hypothetical protein